MYFEQLQQFKKMLKNLDAVLAKTAAHADHKKFDVNNIMTLRLAPDMLAFARQVQIVSDTAKLYSAQMSHQTPPVYEDTEKSWNDLRQRLQKTVTYLESFKKEDFAKGSEAKIAPKWAGGKWLTAHEAFDEFTVHNFYFHATVIYSILRFNGVELGKADYLGNIPFQG